ESHYGTFDQGGNVWEWNEAIVVQVGPEAYRGLRGGSYYDYVDELRASLRPYYYPTSEYGNLGFRVSGVPEPPSLLILGSGILALAGMVRRRRNG
ncbi:MAG TPA: SUMF1/EgtB/PvdO family nonheme iron enzyme, partial [Armatimonadota bacterium]|nr:SUMF1/EgtB/PvdO family nonheme iron enzyme [Armatimonadota bacterium]